MRSRFYFVFFFSSRRRHTRSLCDWSSDVCSSDLLVRSTDNCVHRQGVDAKGRDSPPEAFRVDHHQECTVARAPAGGNLTVPASRFGEASARKAQDAGRGTESRSGIKRKESSRYRRRCEKHLLLNKPSGGPIHGSAV